jgi:hypothetical protein
MPLSKQDGDGNMVLALTLTLELGDEYTDRAQGVLDKTDHGRR